MPTRKLKPDTPSRRFMSVSTFEEITKSKPERKLTTALRKTGGRNNHGRITSRRRGGGHKRRYRIIDFKRNKFDFSGIIESIEYDPNRSPRIALVNYDDGEKRYIIAPDGMKVGDKIISSMEIKFHLKQGMQCHWGKFLTDCWFIILNLNLVRVLKWHEVQAPMLASWRLKVAWLH